MRAEENAQPRLERHRQEYPDDLHAKPITRGALSMRIFVAGATGVIGRRLVPLLVKASHEVSGMTHDASRGKLIESMGAKTVVGDAFDRDALFASLKEIRPEVVIHQLTSLSKFDYAANSRMRTEGTRNLVEAALSVGVRRMIAQSFCFYAPGDGLAREEDPLDQDSPYGRATFDGLTALEQEVATVQEGVVLRYGYLYGSGTGFASDGMIAQQVRNGQFPATDDVTSFVHLEDAANAVLQGLHWPRGVFNIVDNEPAAGTVWLPVYAAQIKAKEPPVGPKSGHRQRGVSNLKAREQLGWKPIYPTWRDGFRKALG